MLINNAGVMRAGRSRVTSQVSVTARSGSIDWDDPNWQRSFHGGRAYAQSNIAFGLFGLELDRRSRAGGWGITSNLSHPIDRDRDTTEVRLIRALSRRGILVGTVETAQLPALMAATAGEARGGRLYGPSGLGHPPSRPSTARSATPSTPSGAGASPRT